MNEDDVMSDPEYVQPTHVEQDYFDAFKEQRELREQESRERASPDLHVDPPKSYEEATHGY